MYMLFVLAFSIGDVVRISAYNTDTSSYRVLKSPRDNSYFGYSLAAAHVNGSLSIWSGSPKYSADGGAEGNAKEGAIYHCEVSSKADGSFQQNCKRIRLKTVDKSVGDNKTNVADDDSDTPHAMEALPKCTFDDGICNYTMDNPPFWFTREEYGRFGRRKYNTKIRAHSCYFHIKAGNKLTGPPSYTIHEGMIGLNSDKAIRTVAFGQNFSTNLVSQQIEAKSKVTQCLRFCYNAYSILDHDENDDAVKSEAWYRKTEKRRIAMKPERSLRVYLEYEDGNQRELYLYQGPSDIASQYWNFTEINIPHEDDGSYKIYFEVTILNKLTKSRICSAAADIVLNDITVTNSNCEVEQEDIDVLEGEQSIGLTLDVNVGDKESTTLTACGPLWQQNCGFAKEATGICYEMKSNSSKPTLIKNPGLKGCIRGKMDIVLLVDQSGSVNQCNFQKVKHWLRNVVRGFAIGPNEQDLGIVLYSNAESTKAVVELGFEKYGNNGKAKKTRMLENLRKLPYEAGKTFTGVAFKYANDLLWGPRAREDAKKMVILLTDGATSPEDLVNLNEQVRITRSRNATILAVGVANYNASELISISGDEGNFFSAKDFSELEKVRDTLRQTVSHSNLEGSRRSKSMQQCQMGFSLHREKDGLLMGAPGCFDRVGDVMHYASHDDDSKLSGSDEGSTMIDSISETALFGNITRTDIFNESQSSHPGEKPATTTRAVGIPTLEDLEEAMNSLLGESYFGYAVTSGEFFGLVAGTYFAASAPRHNGVGAVLLYKSDPPNLMTNSHVLRGHQLGEYFGAVLCAEDVNSDGFTDLFIGAPVHTDANPDEGRVYVYMGGENMSDEPDIVLKGSGHSFSRFGAVITSVADITLDGYADIVVSAPNEDNGKGAVYIFCGGERGMSADFSQRIAASSLGENNFKLFGQSVFGGVDVDNNGYPDIFVGTPGSDKILVFRTKPVAHIDVEFKVISTMIDRRNEKCWAKPTSPEDSCIRCKVCFSYSGLSVPPGINLRYTIHSDVRKPTSRVALPESSDKKNTIQGLVSLGAPNVQVCHDYSLHLKKNILDKMTNVTMELTYDMEDYSPNDTVSATSENTLAPVLDISRSKRHHATTYFKTYCEDTSSCVSDITIDDSGPVSGGGHAIQAYEISKERLIRFSLVLFNKGPEEAHALIITIHYPNFLVFSSVSETDCFKALEQIEDHTIADDFNSVSVILLETLLGMDKKCTGQLYFLATPSMIENRRDFVNFVVNSSTVSRDHNPSDNVKKYQVPVEYKASFTITGQSQPQTISGYITNSTNSTDSLESKFAHVYTIINTGPFTIQNLSLTIEWPTCARQSEDLYFVRHIESTYWHGQSAENNQSIHVDVENPLLLAKNSSVCEEHVASGSGIQQYWEDIQECNSSTVAFCASMSLLIENIPPRQHVNLRLLGEIDLIQFKNAKTQMPITSAFFATVQGNGHLKFSPEQQFELTIATTVYPPYVHDIVRDVKTFTNLPLWAYLVSALAGLLVLLVVICLLRWCGFFESKYAKMKQDAQDGLGDGEETVPMNSDPNA